MTSTRARRRGRNESSSTTRVEKGWLIQHSTTGTFAISAMAAAPGAKACRVRAGRSMLPSGNTPTIPPSFTCRTAVRSVPASSALKVTGSTRSARQKGPSGQRICSTAIMNRMGLRRPICRRGGSVPLAWLATITNPPAGISASRNRL